MQSNITQFGGDDSGSRVLALLRAALSELTFHEKGDLAVHLTELAGCHYSRAMVGIFLNMNAGVVAIATGQALKASPCVNDGKPVASTDCDHAAGCAYARGQKIWDHLVLRIRWDLNS